jgi:putative transposase
VHLKWPAKLGSGIITFTIYAWTAMYGGMEPSEAARPHHLEDENSRLKRLVADLSLDWEMLKVRFL